MQQILDFFKDTFLTEFETTMTGDRIASGLLVSFFVTIFMILVYRVTYQGVSFSKSFCFSLILLSMVTSVVIMTVTSNLALSLGMVGALSIIRFRTAVKDPADTVFMFWSITIGIMAGAGLVYITLITNLALGILYMILYLFANKFRSAPYLIVARFEKEAAGAVEDALRSFRRRKIRSRTVREAEIELCVEVRMKPDELQKIDEMASIKGVVDVSAVSYRGDVAM